jgi:hypothetical protein
MAPESKLTSAQRADLERDFDIIREHCTRMKTSVLCFQAINRVFALADKEQSARMLAIEAPDLMSRLAALCEKLLSSGPLKLLPEALQSDQDQIRLRTLQNSLELLRCLTIEDVSAAETSEGFAQAAVFASGVLQSCAAAFEEALTLFKDQPSKSESCFVLSAVTTDKEKPTRLKLPYGENIVDDDGYGGAPATMWEALGVKRASEDAPYTLSNGVYFPSNQHRGVLWREGQNCFFLIKNAADCLRHLLMDLPEQTKPIDRLEDSRCSGFLPWHVQRHNLVSAALVCEGKTPRGTRRRRTRCPPKLCRPRQPRS